MGHNQTYKFLHSKGYHERKWKDNLQNGRKYLQMMQLTKASSLKYKTAHTIEQQQKKKPNQKMGRRS